MLSLFLAVDLEGTVRALSGKTSLNGYPDWYRQNTRLRQILGTSQVSIGDSADTRETHSERREDKWFQEMHNFCAKHFFLAAHCSYRRISQHDFIN